jgi:hypothetical protein
MTPRRSYIASDAVLQRHIPEASVQYRQRPEGADFMSLETRVDTLRTKHQELDRAVGSIEASPSVDSLDIVQLKKRKASAQGGDRGYRFQNHASLNVLQAEVDGIQS